MVLGKVNISNISDILGTHTCTHKNLLAEMKTIQFGNSRLFNSQVKKNDIQGKKFRLRAGGMKKKSSDNDQLTGHLQSFFSFFFLISPEQTVNLVR